MALYINGRKMFILNW